jgi:hypothetical protein
MARLLDQSAVAERLPENPIDLFIHDFASQSAAEMQGLRHARSKRKGGGSPEAAVMLRSACLLVKPKCRILPASHATGGPSDLELNA